MPKNADPWYDPETGKLWREAGCLSRNGYRQVWFRGKQHMEHRVAWFLYYGTWPDALVDHINGNRQDNRICNLRLATPSENLQNRGRPKNNTSGFKGVTRKGNNEKWQATIRVGRYEKYLGSFDDINDAADAYHRAALRYHGKFAYLDL